MLSTSHQFGSSPTSKSSSPRCQPYQYASPPIRRATTTSRRSSSISETSPAPGPAPTPEPARGVHHYVDRGTQYSPPTGEMNIGPPNLAWGEMHRRQPSGTIAPTVVVAAPPPARKTALGAESPSMKKRTSPVEIPSNVKNDPALHSKRTKRAKPAAKLLPAKYEFCEVGDMVVLIANMVSELIETNDALPLQSGVLTRFHSRTPPGISVLDYLQRLAKHATLTPPLLLSMVYYIDRLCLLYPAFTINTLTVHRFLITAATVAAKGLSDLFWNNATYARVGGIKITELCVLELEFLYRVDWKIVPNPEILVDYYRGLVERSDLYELDDDSSSVEDEEEKEHDHDHENADPNTQDVAATDVKWRAWMEDVSKEKAVQENASDEKME